MSRPDAEPEPGSPPAGMRRRVGCVLLLLVLALLALGTCVVGVFEFWLLAMKGGALDAVSPTVVTFFEATTRGDVAAANSHMRAGEHSNLAARIAKDPESFRVRAVSDFTPIQVPHHHPFVIGAKLTLENGRVKYGRFLLFYYHERKRWVIDGFEIGDRMPETPTLGDDPPRPR